MAHMLVSIVFFRSHEEIPADCVYSSVLIYHIRSVRKHILVTMYCITLGNSDTCIKRIFNNLKT